MRSVYGAVIISLLFSLSNAWAQVGDNTALNLAWHEASDTVFARSFFITPEIWERHRSRFRGRI